MKCRDIIQFHSKRLNSIKRCQFRELQNQFNKLQKLNVDNPGIYDSEIQEVQFKLSNI